jgi:hypothetical protein
MSDFIIHQLWKKEWFYRAIICTGMMSGLIWQILFSHIHPLHFLSGMKDGKRSYWLSLRYDIGLKNYLKRGTISSAIFSETISFVPGVMIFIWYRS